MPLEKSDLTRWERAQYYTSYLALRGVIAGMRALPYARRIALMGRIMSALGPVVGFRKRIRDNLALVCPDLPEAEVARLCKAVPDNAGRSIMEHFSPEEFVQRQQTAPITGPGCAALKEAIQQGRPVLMIGAHFGHYMATRVAVQHQFGKPMGCFYRRMANPYFNDIYVDAFEKTGKPLFEQGRRGMSQMVRHVKNSGVVAIVADLHAHGGQELMFFGKPAVTSVLNAELALKYDALMIPCHAIRQDNGLDFEIHISDPIPHTDPMTMTQAINDDLETLVRDHMGQWFWIHRRWKPWYDRGIQPGDD